MNSSPIVMQRSRFFKLVICGDGGVGKTTLVERYITGRFSSETKMTLGANFYHKIIELEKKGRADLQIWDFGGEDRFRFILPSYVRGANGIMFLFSLTDPETLMHYRMWEDIFLKEDPNIPVILVGAKADAVSNRRVSNEEALKVAKKKSNIKKYIEISSKTGLNVEKTFKSISKDMWDYWDDKLRF